MIQRRRGRNMRCIRCGAEAGDGDAICKNCGAPLGTPNGAAGNINSQGRIYQNGTGGKGSGQESRNNAGGNSPESGYQNYGGGHNYSGSGAPNNGAGPGQRSLPAFIVGLIGSILGMLGGLCTSMCDFRTGGNASFVLIFGGAVVGLIGSCMCLNKARTGSVLQLVGALMMIICVYGITGAEFMSIFGLILLLTGGIIGIVQSYFIKK